MRITSLLALSALVVVAGCSTPDSNSAYTTYPTYTSPVLNPSEMDRTLESSVRSQLNRYGDLANASSNVQIAAQNGAVTLTGTVPTEEERRMIDLVARNTSGVVAVNDQLQVQYPPTGIYPAPAQVYPQTGAYTAPAQVYSSQPVPVVTPPSVPAYPAGRNVSVQATTESDRLIAQAISDRLRPDSAITAPVPGVTITVTDGRAYVRGSVSNEEQRQAIISAVRYTPGVVTVYDQLTLRQ